MKDRTGKVVKFAIASAKAFKSGFLVELEGLSSVNEAERYRGGDILVRKDALPRKEEDEYFWYELLGIDVFLDSGEYIGSISDIIATGSNDIYVVRSGEEEVLVPGTHEIIKDIDLERGKMMIHPIEGLLEMHEI